MTAKKIRGRLQCDYFDCQISEILVCDMLFGLWIVQDEDEEAGTRNLIHSPFQEPSDHAAR